MIDPIKELKRLRAFRSAEDQDEFRRIVTSSASPEAALAAVQKRWTRDSALERTLGAGAQVVSALPQAGEGASKLVGFEGGKRFFGKINKGLDRLDPHGGVAGTAAEVSKIGGHVALAGLTGAGAAGLVGKVGTKLPALARGAAALRAASGAKKIIGGAESVLPTGRAIAAGALRQGLRTAPLTVALANTERGGYTSSKFGVKPGLARVGVDLAEDIAFGGAVSKLGAMRQASKLKKAGLLKDAEEYLKKQGVEDAGEALVEAPKTAPKPSAAPGSAAAKLAARIKARGAGAEPPKSDVRSALKKAADARRGKVEAAPPKKAPASSEMPGDKLVPTTDPGIKRGYDIAQTPEYRSTYKANGDWIDPNHEGVEPKDWTPAHEAASKEARARRDLSSANKKEAKAAADKAKALADVKKQNDAERGRGKKLPKQSATSIDQPDDAVTREHTSDVPPMSPKMQRQSNTNFIEDPTDVKGKKSVREHVGSLDEAGVRDFLNKLDGLDAGPGTIYSSRVTLARGIAEKRLAELVSEATAPLAANAGAKIPYKERIKNKSVEELQSSLTAALKIKDKKKRAYVIAALEDELAGRPHVAKTADEAVDDLKSSIEPGKNDPATLAERTREATREQIDLDKKRLQAKREDGTLIPPDPNAKTPVTSKDVLGKKGPKKQATLLGSILDPDLRAQIEEAQRIAVTRRGEEPLEQARLAALLKERQTRIDRTAKAKAAAADKVAREKAMAAGGAPVQGPTEIGKPPRGKLAKTTRKVNRRQLWKLEQAKREKDAAEAAAAYKAKLDPPAGTTPKAPVPPKTRRIPAADLEGRLFQTAPGPRSSPRVQMEWNAKEASAAKAAGRTPRKLSDIWKEKGESFSEAEGAPVARPLGEDAQARVANGERADLAASQAPLVPPDEFTAGWRARRVAKQNEMAEKLAEKIANRPKVRDKWGNEVVPPKPLTEAEKHIAQLEKIEAELDAKLKKTPHDRQLNIASIAAGKATAKAKAELRAIAEKDIGKAGAGAVIGGALGGAEAASASDGESRSNSDVAETIGLAALTGGALAIGAGKGFRQAGRSINSAARAILTEPQRIAAMTPSQRAKFLAERSKGLKPSTGPAPHHGPALLDVNAPHPALGGKTPRDYFNFDREEFVDLSPETKADLASRYIEQVEPKTVETRAMLKQKVDGVLKRLPPAVLATIDPSDAGRAETVAMATVMLKLEKEIEHALATMHQLGRVERLVTKTVIDAKSMESMQLGRLISRAGTETGRDLNAFKTIGRMVSPSMFVARMERLLARDLSAAEAMKLRDLFQVDQDAAMEYVASLNKTSGLDKVVHLRNTGLLFGVPGRVRDVISSQTNLAMETASAVPGSLLDQIFGAKTGRLMREAGMDQAGPLRSLTRPTQGQLLATGLGIGRGVSKFAHETTGWDAFRDAPAGQRMAKWVEEIRRTKLNADQLRSRDIPKIVNYDTPAVDVYTKGTQRIVAGVDNITKSGAMEAEKHNMARVLAAQDVADGKIPAGAQPARIAEYIKSPTTEMEEAMHQFAVETTFQNKGAAAIMARAIKHELPRAISAFDPRVGAAFRAIVNMNIPFATTGANIGAVVMDHTPLGLARGALMMNGLHDDIVSGLELSTARIRARQRDAVNAFARAATGTSVILATAGTGLALYKKGLITGQVSSDPATRDAEEAAGRSPNSINIMGYWVPYSQYSPLGNVLSVAATMGRAIEEGVIPEVKDARSLLTNLVKMGPIAIRSVLDQPLVTGLKSAMDVANDPAAKGASYLAQQAGSFVPTMVNDVAYATDAGRGRMIDKTDFLSNVGGNVVRRIPGARKYLPQDYDLLGAEVRPRQGGGPLSALLPISGMRERTAPVAETLRRAGGGARLPRRGPDESLDDYSERLRITGLGVRNAMKQSLGGAPAPWPKSVAEREELQDWVRSQAGMGRSNVQGALRARNLLPKR